MRAAEELREQFQLPSVLPAIHALLTARNHFIDAAARLTEPNGYAADGGEEEEKGERKLLTLGWQEEALITLLRPHNVLVQLVCFVRGELRGITAKCAQCEREVAHAGMALVTCDAPSCRLSYDSVGIDYDICQRLSEEWEVMDLLVSAFATANATRALTNAPASLLPAARPAEGRLNLHFDYRGADGQVDIPSLIAVLDYLPPTSTLKEWMRQGMASFIDQMNELHVRLIPTLRWLFYTNPSHIRVLARSERLSLRPPPLRQYVVLQSPPDVDAAFERRKAQKRESVVVWYRPSSARLHEIFRLGLEAMARERVLAPLYLEWELCESRPSERVPEGEVCQGVVMPRCIFECEVIGDMTPYDGSNELWRAQVKDVRIRKLLLLPISS